VRIPKLSRHKSGWWFVRINGKHQYLSKQKQEAQSLYRDLMAQRFGVAVPAPAGGITVRELLDRHAAWQLEQCQPRWRTNRRGILKLCQADALALYGHLPAAAFGPACLQAVRKRIASPARTREYVNSLITKLRGAWKWGVGHELVPLATYQALHLVPDLQPGELGLPEGTARQPVSPDLVTKTLPYLTDRAADLVRLLQLTAARPDELVRLKASDIERHEDGTWTYTPRHHKTSKANRRRLLVFNAEARAILSKYLLKSDSYLFPADPCQRLSAGTEPHYRVSSLCNAVKRACVRAKMPTFTPYQIRHAVITEVSLRHGLDVAQALAGHSTAAMTAHYDHGQLVRAKRAVG
jgi:integrase